MSNETFSNAFLARVQACRDAVAGTGNMGQPSPAVLNQKMRAIKALQHGLSNHATVDEASLLAMVQLGLLEVRVSPLFNG